MSREKHSPIMQFKELIPFRFSCNEPTLQLVEISKLGLNSKIKKFSNSFICGKGCSPSFGGK